MDIIPVVAFMNNNHCIVSTNKKDLKNRIFHRKENKRMSLDNGLILEHNIADEWENEAHN